MPAAPGVGRPLANRFLVAYAVLYTTFLSLMHTRGGFSLTDPLLVLAIVGFAFSALAWWATRGLAPHPFVVRHPAAECAVLAVYLLVVMAFLTWGIDAIDGVTRTGLGRGLTLLAAKVVVFVATPLALFAGLWGYDPRALVDRSSSWRGHAAAALWMSLALVLFQVVFGRGLAEVRGAGLGGWPLVLGVPVVFAWLAIEVGVVEEVFFRVLVQSRLSAWLGCEVGGIVLMSLLFGLAHAPGFYFRTGRTFEGLGPSPSLLMAVGYSIVMTSVTGFFFGILWARTRNLVVLVVVHAAGDLVPNLVDTLKMWLGK